MTPALFDHFSFIAPLYDKLIHTGSRQKLLQLMALSSQHRVLDAGGGTGRIAQIIQEYVFQVVVADLSFQMLWETTLKENLQPVNTLLEILPFNDETFDRVVIVDALHHMADQTKTAKELWRVLKPGGCIVIEEPNIHTLSVKFIAICEKILLMNSHFLSPERIVKLFDFTSVTIQVDEEGINAWISLKKGTL